MQTCFSAAFNELAASSRPTVQMTIKLPPRDWSGIWSPPPLPTVSSEEPIEQHVTPDDEIPEELHKDEEEDEQIPEVNDNDLEEDNEGDRDYDHNLVGRKIRALYNNGWFTGKVLYHNTKMDKLNVRFSDDTDDYISCDEINDTDVQLL